MARINSNTSALVAYRHLNNSYGALNTTIQRLSSGLRINRGADDPAGLIASERLRSEIGAVNQAIGNTQRASTIIATTEGALDEVSRLLNDIQSLVVEAANSGALSQEEIEANQLQVDSAIASITRVANSTTFAGKHLLDGSMDYLTSGVNNSQINSLKLNSVMFGTASYVPIDVNVTQSAQLAQLQYLGSSVATDVTLEIGGNKGVTTLNFGAGTAVSAVVRAINQVEGATGVKATLINSANPASGFAFTSEALGSSQFVSVSALPGGGTFQVQDTAGNLKNRTYGRDVIATVNGAATQGDGNTISLGSTALDMKLTLADTFGVGTTSFAITGGGAKFQVGPMINSNLQVGIGVQSVAASRLGNTALGFLSQIASDGPYALTKDKAEQAQLIIVESAKQVAVLRGRLGAFEKNVLDTNVNQLSVTMENLTSAESAIRDADFAQETSNLARNQILVQSGTSVLKIANQTPQSVLALLQ